MGDFVCTSSGMCFVCKALRAVVLVVCLPIGSIVEDFVGDFGHISRGMVLRI